MYWTIQITYRDYDDRKHSETFISWGESPSDSLHNLTNVLEDNYRELEAKVLPAPFAIDSLLVAKVIAKIE